MLPEDIRILAIGKIASEVAYLQTIEEYENSIATMMQAMQSPTENEESKKAIKRMCALQGQKLKAFKEKKALIKEYNEVMTTILEAADKQRLKRLILDDRTTAYVIEAQKEEDDTLMLMPAETGK